MGYLNANFITHKVTFMIFGDTFFGGLAVVKFLGKGFRTFLNTSHRPTYHKAISGPEQRAKIMWS